MNELLFPTLGAAAVIVVVLPLCAALSKVLLLVLDRLAGPRLIRWSAARYVLLVLPSTLPIVWTISAGLHQAESGRSVLGCIFLHEFEELCVEPLLFVALLTAVAFGRVGPWLMRCPRLLRVEERRDSREATRVASLVASNAVLEALSGRVVVMSGLTSGSAATGLWRPVVAIDPEFVNRCDDDTLVGALAHELEHLRGGDTLRYMLLALAMRLNPLGSWLLMRDAAAWIFRREVQCDRAAVLAGAEPFAIASALLCASRPGHVALAHIGGGAGSRIGLRIELLLAYAERRPDADSAHERSVLGFLSLVAIAVTAIPHVAGTNPLDVLHTTIERMASTFLN